MAKRKTKEERERAKRQKKARKAIKGLLTRLRKGCAQFESVDSWLSFVREKVKPVAEGYADVIPEDTLETMRKADQLLEATLSAVRTACQVLTGKLEETLLALTTALATAGLLGTGSATIVALSAVVVAAVAVGAVVFTSVIRRTELRLVNQGCPTVVFPEELGPAGLIPGVSFPAQVETDAEEQVVFPAVGASLQAEPDALTVRILGYAIPLPLAPELGDLRYDDQPLLGRGEVPLETGEHTLAFLCR